jgi:hypothetical protein
MRVQLTRAGAVVDASDSEIDALRSEFDRRHCILLRQVVEPGLLATLQRAIADANFFEKTNVNIGDEMRVRPGAVASAFEFLTNDPALFAFVRRISGCSRIGSYRGRVYRLLPRPGHMSDWHNDLLPHRMLTMSINLGPVPYEGGILQIRDRNSGEILTEIANTGPGDATIFQIADSLQHRVTPLTGMVPRTACAGWFMDEPDFALELRARLAGEDTAA